MFALVKPYSRNTHMDERPSDCIKKRFGLRPFIEREFIMPKPKAVFDPFSLFERELDVQKASSDKKPEKTQLVTVTDDKFEVKLDVSKFSPSELNVKIVDNSLVIEGKHEEKDDRNNFVSHNFIRKFLLPDGVISDQMTSSLSKEGLLLISSPRKIEKPKPKGITIPITFVGKENQVELEAK